MSDHHCDGKIKLIIRCPIEVSIWLDSVESPAVRYTMFVESELSELVQ